MRKLLLGAALTALLTASTGPASWAATPPEKAAETSGYIVVLRPGGESAKTFARQFAGNHRATSIGHIYTTALSGFSAKLTPADVRALRADPQVAYVEPDRVAHITAQETANGVRRTFTADNPGLKVGDGKDERVDADVAVLDTGIDFDHPDLNVVQRTNCLNTATCADNTGDDDNGHGSNVAGIAGSLDNGIGYVGVAPGARLWSVKVLNQSGSGNQTGIIAGLDWVAKHADEIEVANLSLGFNGTVQAVNDAVNGAIAKGIIVTASAGNSKKDAKDQSPANVPDAITVSSLSDSDGKPGGTGGGFGWCNQNNKNKDDTLSDYSNWGTIVDLIAPGDCIKSAYKNGGYSNFSGTSQAAPHAAGAAAWLTTNGNKPTNRAEVLAIRDTLVAEGNSNWTDTAPDNAKEPLLDLSNTQIFPPKPKDPGAPTAKITASCSNDQATCSFDGSGSTDADGTIASYAWEFGDGKTGSGKMVSHTYAKSGYYSVSLTVTDNEGKTHKTRQQFKAGNVAPTASIGGNSCIAQPKCTFDASGSTDPEGMPMTYKWDFGDGTSGTGVKVEHAYSSKDAKYTVMLTVSDDKGQTGTAKTEVDCKKLLDSVQCYSF
ncbi:PKD domain-containing protein [Streptomyces sp. KR80]|uniref:PKD domain-containing protein n=1 Tax=Streptomyces sp. KR80 TaxID=3457426 RepID=UPI003FCF25D7